MLFRSMSLAGLAVFLSSSAFAEDSAVKVSPPLIGVHIADKGYFGNALFAIPGADTTEVRDPAKVRKLAEQPKYVSLKKFLGSVSQLSKLTQRNSTAFAGSFVEENIQLKSLQIRAAYEENAYRDVKVPSERFADSSIGLVVRLEVPTNCPGLTSDQSYRFERRAETNLSRLNWVEVPGLGRTRNPDELVEPEFDVRTKLFKVNFMMNRQFSYDMQKKRWFQVFYDEKKPDLDAYTLPKLLKDKSLEFSQIISQACDEVRKEIALESETKDGGASSVGSEPDGEEAL